MPTVAHLDPELDTVRLVVESQPLPGQFNIFSWRITGKKKLDVENEIERLKSGLSHSIFTVPNQVESDPYRGWYFALGVTFANRE